MSTTALTKSLEAASSETQFARPVAIPRTIQLLGLWAGLFALILLVYSKALNAALIYDDVAMLLYFTPDRNFQWYDSFSPLDNGFLRPIHVLIYWLTWILVISPPHALRLYKKSKFIWRGRSNCLDDLAGHASHYHSQITWNT